MTMPRRRSLPLIQSWSTAHDNDIFKHELRSKAAVEAYFATLGTSVVSFNGTEGVDYEFDADNGFRTLTNSGGMKITLSNITAIAGDPLKYLFNGGWSLDFQLLASQWIEPDVSAAVATPYLHPVPDMTGAAAGALSNTYLLSGFVNTSTQAFRALLLDDTTTVNGKGRNRLQFGFSANPGNPGMCARPISVKNKGTYLDCRVTSISGQGNAWIDQIPGVRASGGGVVSVPGERFGYRNSANHSLPSHTTGTCLLWVGTYAGASAACTRWIRNLRMYNTVTKCAPHPMLARVISFGDSYSMGAFGPGPSSATDSSIGDDGSPGSYSTVVDTYMADIHPQLRFQQLIAQAGYQIGGMYGGGQGGHWLHSYSSGADTQSLYTLGYAATFTEKYLPTMVFTFGLYNDIGRVRAGAITTASLQSELIANYLLPVMQKGCSGWGFVIPAYSKAFVDGGATWTDAFDEVATMLLGLPDVWDAAYPAYAGRVKVYDMRAEMGDGSLTNVNWRSYFETGEETHPSKYGGYMFAEKCAQMALEWLRGA